jgi:hypothetical protein
MNTIEKTALYVYFGMSSGIRTIQLLFKKEYEGYLPFPDGLCIDTGIENYFASISEKSLTQDGSTVNFLAISFNPILSENEREITQKMQIRGWILEDVHKTQLAKPKREALSFRLNKFLLEPVENLTFLKKPALNGLKSKNLQYVWELSLLTEKEIGVIPGFTSEMRTMLNDAFNTHFGKETKKYPVELHDEEIEWLKKQTTEKEV